MNLIKTSILNGIAVVIKMLTLLIINKVLAIYVGPAGYAVIGQFQNAVQIITTFASGAINTGVIKYTAEYHDNTEKQHALWQTAGTISFISSAIVAVLISIFNQSLADYFLKDETLGNVFIWFSVTLFLFVFNGLILAILNGKKEIKLYVVANIAGSFFSLLVTGIMTANLGLYGALVALATYHSFSFFVTACLVWKRQWFRFNYLLGKIGSKEIRNLSKFMAMAITSAICVPLSHILIRNYLGQELGWDKAGQWEAVSRISSAYLMLVTTTLSVYYLPRLSELNCPSEIRNEIIQGFKIILPFVSLCSVIIYLYRDFIIIGLFTPEFAPAHELFAWHMFGDTIKIASWLLSYFILAKAMVKTFIITEVLFSLFFYVLTFVFVDFIGFKGVAVAYSVCYFAYFWAMLYFVFNYKK